MDRKTYDLNISERYVPNWGAWEVGREVISNAIDADRKGYKVATPASDVLQVTTRTRPTLAQIKFIGGGTKDSSTQTIGCFGEGIKLAAMVCLRLGGQMRIKFDDYVVQYELRHDEDLGCRSIMMHVDGVEFMDGMVVEIILENIARVVSGKFLQDPKIGMVEKIDPERLIIYNRGVFVAEKPTKSLYDWNLASAVNRDRNVIDFWEVGSAIASIIDSRITTAIARQILESPADMFEVECMKKHSYVMGHRTAQALLDAIKEQHGTEVVMATDDIDANRLAKRLGKKVILIDDAFRKIIQTISPEDRIPSADEIMTHEDRLNIDYEKKWEMSDLLRIVEAIEIPAEIFVFEDGKDKPLGMAEFKQGRRRVFLNASLWEPGRKTERLGTFVHELAHLHAKAADGSFQFEDALTAVCGRLARLFLEGAGEGAKR